jgi:tetratricopeptide (TPR) repeat protein
VDAFKQAIYFNRYYEEAYLFLGMVSSELGLYEEAIEAFTRAVNLNSVYAISEAHKQAIGIKPDYAQVNIALGRAYAKVGRYTPAADAFRKAIAIKADHAQAHYSLGLTFLLLDDKNAALEQYNRLLALGDNQMANALLDVIHKRNK